MGDVNISELLGDQPLIDEGEGGEQELLDQGGGDQGGQEPPENVVENDQQQPRPKSKVPLAALQEERTRRQELQDQLKTQQETNRRMEERFGQMMQLVQQGQQQQIQQEHLPEIPAFVDDPEGHINALKNQLQAELEQVRAFQQQTVQQQHYAVQGQQVAQQVAAAEEEFRQRTPDYNDAANFFMQRKTLEYTAMGADPISVQQAVQRDYQSIAIGAIKTGKNAGELLYALSKAMGYAPQKPGQPRQQPAPQQRQAPSSLSNLSGAPRAPDEEGGITLESVANMTDTEFDKYWKEMERNSRQRPKF